MNEPILVVMAAGMGSRFGGLKQIEPVGVNGEIIMDFSLYDAMLAGFKKAVFIIKEENYAIFNDEILASAKKYIDIEFVFQKLNDIPVGFTLPKGREKPWGTGHAALMAARAINQPFAVINADDFYGREAFKQLYDFLRTAEDNDKQNFAMVGYHLKNTITEMGYVSRGVCEDENGYLKNIVERKRIEKHGEEIAFSEDGSESWNNLSGDTIVSMNFFGFTYSFSKALEQGFTKFFQRDVPKNPLKAEFFLPFVVNDLITEEKARVKLLSSSDKWYGVTYKEDKETVVNAIKDFVENGVYPSPLWGA